MARTNIRALVQLRNLRATLMPKSGGVIENYAEKVVVSHSTEGEKTLDIAEGNVHELVLDGDTVLDFNSILPSIIEDKNVSFTLILHQKDPARVVTFPANISWRGDEEPITNETNKVFVLSFMSTDFGARWYGMEIGSFANIPVPVNPNAPSSQQFGLQWNQTQNTYARLDDSVGMVANAMSLTVYDPVNDFDNVMPWSGIRRCNLADNGMVNAYFGDVGFVDDGSNGQVMVQIPKFWYKSELDTTGDRIFRWWISGEEIAGYKVHPAFVRNGVEKDYVYIGAYEARLNGDKLESRSGVTGTVNRTIAQFRSGAQARGIGWEQQDFLTTSALQLLYLIEYAHFNSQAKIGLGYTNTFNSKTTGFTLNYGNTSFGSVSSGSIPMSYRGVEDLYGSKFQIIDGCNMFNRVAFVADHSFENNKISGNYNSSGFTSSATNGWSTDIGWTLDSDYMFLCISTVSTESLGKLHDWFTGNSESRIPIFGGHQLSTTGAGAFSWRFHFAPTSATSETGARLLFIP